MEAVAAIELATNIIHLIDLAHGISSAAIEIHRSTSGFTKEIEQFRSSVQAIRGGLDRALDTLISNPEDQAFHDDLRGLQENVDRFSAEIDDLEIKKPGSMLHAVKAAWRGRRKKREFDESLGMIDTMGSRVTVHIITVHLSRMDNKLDKILDRNVQLEANVSEKMEELKESILKMRNGTRENEEMLMKALKSWFENQQVVAHRREFLKALHFQEMDHRQDEVKEAHRETFQWMFLDDEHDFKFSEWLQSQDSGRRVFWVSGKPGSGKSTLMRFLCDHARVRHCLKVWVGDNRLVVASYFFWQAGSKLQNSINGLLRTLLFQILVQCPELIDLVFPPTKGTQYVLPESKFSKAQLHQSLSLIFDASESRGIRYCFFIDGLDEYDGLDESEAEIGKDARLLNVIETFNRSSCIKICVSSRPWRVFEASLGRDPSNRLYIHQLTAADIGKYVQEKLKENKIFKELSKNDDNYNELFGEILEAAQGVFLWVTLAVQMLLDGVTNSDSISDLRRRMKVLPKSLHDLYSYILLQTEPVYQERCAESLLVASLDLGTGHYGLPLLRYSCLDTYRNSTEQLERLELNAVKDMLNITSTQLGVCCRGLLHIYDLRTAQYPNGLLVEMTDPYVKLSHRTVRDFLMAEKIQDHLRRAARPGFDAVTALASSTATYLEALLSYSEESFATCTAKFRRHDTRSCYHSLTELPEILMIRDFNKINCLVNQILDDRKRSIMYYIFWSWKILSMKSCKSYLQPNLFDYLAAFGFEDLCHVIIEHDPQILKGSSKPPTLLFIMLAHLIRLTRGTISNSEGIKNSVNFILEHGADPNEEYCGLSVWRLFLGCYYCARTYDKIQRELVHIFETLLRHGADTQVKVPFYTLPSKDGASEGLIYYPANNVLPAVALLERVVRKGEPLDDMDSPEAQAIVAQEPLVLGLKDIIRACISPERAETLLALIDEINEKK